MRLLVISCILYYYSQRMIKILVLIIGFMPVFIHHAFAQSPEEAKPYRIGGSLGYSITGYREETDLPINRFINSLTFIIDGNIEKERLLHSLILGFFRGENRPITADPPLSMFEFSPLEPLEHGNQYFVYYQTGNIISRAYGEYALDYRLWGNSTFPGYLGGAVRLDAYIKETPENYFFTTVTGIASLNIHVTQKWIINRENYITASLSLPVFGYAIRPDFFGQHFFPLESGFTGLHNYWAVFGEMKYQHTINALFSLYTGLGFEVSRINFPRSRNDAALRFNSGLAVTF